MKTKNGINYNWLGQRYADPPVEEIMFNQIPLLKYKINHLTSPTTTQNYNWFYGKDNEE